MVKQIKKWFYQLKYKDETIYVDNMEDYTNSIKQKGLPQKIKKVKEVREDETEPTNKKP